MPLIPLFVQNEVNTDASNRVSAFNFCNGFDFVLPTPNGDIGVIDRQHLWGNYSGIAPQGEVIQEEPIGGGIPPEKRKKLKIARQREYEDAYELAKWKKKQRKAIIKAVEAEVEHKPKPKLKLDVSQAEIKMIASIDLKIDRMLAIEQQLKYLEFKRLENDALAVLLLIS